MESLSNCSQTIKLMSDGDRIWTTPSNSIKSSFLLQRDGFSQCLQAFEIPTLRWARFQHFVGEEVVALCCQAGLELVITEV